jgi:hypothetical protein
MPTVPYVCPTLCICARRAERLAREEKRPQAEIVRDAIAAYRPESHGDRNFALAWNFERIDSDPRPLSEIPKDELMRGARWAIDFAIGRWPRERRKHQAGSG